MCEMCSTMCEMSIQALLTKLFKLILIEECIFSLQNKKGIRNKEYGSYMKEENSKIRRKRILRKWSRNSLYFEPLNVLIKIWKKFIKGYCRGLSLAIVWIKLCGKHGRIFTHKQVTKIRINRNKELKEHICWVGGARNTASVEYELYF